MKHLINREEVPSVVFKTSIETSMEILYGDVWVDSMKDIHLNYILDNLRRNGIELCINHICYQIEGE
jgi:hypothetical protein